MLFTPAPVANIPDMAVSFFFTGLLFVGICLVGYGIHLYKEGK